MPEWEYIRLMGRNYLQVKSKPQMEESFQYRMVTAESIRGLLPCKAREVNGIRYLLYDISSMQSLRSIYAEKKMNFEEFYQFVFSLKRTIKSMEAYLLEAENLLLYPEFIFQDIDTKETCFLYNLHMTDDKEDCGKSLYHFLLEVIEHEEDALTEIVYQMYDKMEGDWNTRWVEEVYRQLEQSEGNQKESKEENEEVSEGVCKEVSKEGNPDNPKTNDTVLTRIVCQTGETDENIASENDGREEVHARKRKRALYISLSGICAAGLFVSYLYTNYILTVTENLLLWGILLVLAGGVALFFHLWLKQGASGKQGKVCSKAKDMQAPVFDREYHPCDDANWSFEWGENADSIGKTVYFEATEIENKLYGIGKKNRKTIELTKFPFTIGKKENAVDAVLDDASISRMHARFWEQDKKLYLMDLNSTNGTYKNGMMLAPNEQVEVLPEDEIRFGKLSFLYR